MENKNRNFPTFYNACNVSHIAILFTVITEFSHVNNDHLNINNNNDYVIHSPERLLFLDRPLQMIHVTNNKHSSHYK